MALDAGRAPAAGADGGGAARKGLLLIGCAARRGGRVTIRMRTGKKIFSFESNNCDE